MWGCSPIQEEKGDEYEEDILPVDDKFEETVDLSRYHETLQNLSRAASKFFK